MPKVSKVFVAVNGSKVRALSVCNCAYQHHPFSPRQDQHDVYLLSGVVLPEGEVRVAEIVEEPERDPTRPSYCFGPVARQIVTQTGEKPPCVGDGYWGWLLEGQPREPGQGIFGA